MPDFNNLASDMVSKEALQIILRELESVKDIEGAVVELGCNIGTTSVFIQDYLKGSKEFHVYDSFEGLPEKHEKDANQTERQFIKGQCLTNLDNFLNTFYKEDITPPEIHIGWFKDAELPEKISFACFDGDFYTSIMDSWEKVYSCLSPGAVVCVHDYGWDVLPGVKLACDDFLSDKPETMTCENFIGILKKM
jgi:O-methyltransferase